MKGGDRDRRVSNGVAWRGAGQRDAAEAVEEASVDGGYDQPE